MTKGLVRLTKDQLERQIKLPNIYKTAIEQAIYQVVNPDEPEDAVWPEFFRAEVVNMEADCELRERLEDDEYMTEACWFQSGWKARERIDSIGRRESKAM